MALYFDMNKQLPHTDPFDRQLTIGLGCFLELMRMAASANGYSVEMELFPEGEDASGLDNRPVAYAKFTATEPQSDPLFAKVMERRSYKQPFDTGRNIDTSTLAAILNVANSTVLGGSVDPADIAFWRTLTSDALKIEIETPHTYKESVDLFRIGKSEINASPDGIDLGGPMIEALALTGLMSREASLDVNSTAYTQGLAAVLANTESAMGHIWMVTPDNTRVDQLNAGADWLRVNLACAEQGISFHPLSQALQEYPEMANIFAQTHERLAPDGGTVQMLARIGYGSSTPVSPRWPLDSKIGTA
ncbi:hypothetical protein KIN_41170 [Litoreibacter roseus]|uniref:Nitroreductase family protein n=1 Tax=Litoreibacter roseus TaxID=2601869 RepID=A0A6N6JL58_9RHOB|nr:hypothetical protein KIN_41170 [Litoreibacter roseus]